MSTTPAKPPEILDKIVDLVLSHKPKIKQTSKKNKSSSTSQAAKSKSKNKHGN